MGFELTTPCAKAVDGYTATLPLFKYFHFNLMAATCWVLKWMEVILFLNFGFQVTRSLTTFYLSCTVQMDQLFSCIHGG